MTTLTAIIGGTIKGSDDLVHAKIGTSVTISCVAEGSIGTKVSWSVKVSRLWF